MRLFYSTPKIGRIITNIGKSVSRVKNILRVITKDRNYCTLWIEIVIQALKLEKKTQTLHFSKYTEVYFIQQDRILKSE